MEMRTIKINKACEDVDLKYQPLEPDTDDWVSLILKNVLLKCWRIESYILYWINLLVHIGELLCFVLIHVN